MKTNLLFILSLVALNMGVMNAQTAVLDESLMTQESFNKFTVVSVTGSQVWYFNSTYGATISGYATPNSYENEDWLISPELNLLYFDDTKLSFDHTRGSQAVMNVGVAEGWYQVFATAYYTGDVATTVWTEITGINHAVPSVWTFISSGELAIPATALSAGTRIAFRYRSSDTQSCTWEVKNVKVYGTPAATQTGIFDFKITTWNTENLSCTDEAKDSNIHINNVVSVIKAIEPDLIALQEVGTSYLYPTIDTLIRRLGSEWAGNIVPSSNSNCSQNQGIIYKKAKIQFVNASLMNSGESYNGNSYYVNWSSGRYPVLYNVKLLAGGEPFPVSFVNIHAKSATDDASYLRREGASYALKNILDGNTHKANRVVILGDFNDYLVGTNCVVCDDISPYKNFIDDAVNYKGLTGGLQNYHCTNDFYYNNPVIDNIIISNELFDNYISNSVTDEVPIVRTIPNYGSTTSDHAPISFKLRFITGNIVAVSSVSLDKNATSLTVGEIEQLTATVLPENATDKAVSWHSSIPSVASVSNGLITALSKGTTDITVCTADGAKIAICEVRVTDLNIEEPTLILRETFGNGALYSPWPTVAAYTAYIKEGMGAGNVSYSSTGTVSIRSNLPSNYAGASEACHVAFTGNNGGAFLIHSIDPMKATTFSLSFGTNRISSETLTVDFNTGASWTNIPYTKTTTNDTWELIASKFNIPSNSAVLNLRFSAGATQYGVRVDDITLSAVIPQNITELSANRTINLYPNPIKDKLRIESGELTIGKLEITDLSGSILMSCIPQTSEIDVSHLQKGVYLVRVSTENGVVVGKVVKK